MRGKSVGKREGLHGDDYLKPEGAKRLAFSIVALLRKFVVVWSLDSECGMTGRKRRENKRRRT